MCDETLTTDKKEQDAAACLADILNRESGITVSAFALRRLIGKKWDRIKVLAHRIHDEETAEQRQLNEAIKTISVLSEDGLRNVIQGHACKEVAEAWRLVTTAARR